ncbi:MAG: hypothetical protein KJZ69_00745 [Phycisphaerales bacterium]|nr:hypothetical protein [Phycisphaerales bacterium]
MASAEGEKSGGKGQVSTAAEPNGAGKRRFARYAWKTTVQVLWLEEHVYGSSVPMRTMDLSAGGIALLSASWVHLHRFGAVLLTNGPGQHSIRWLEVMHGRYVTEKKAHVIGCRWIPAPENAPPVRVVEAPGGPRLEFETESFTRP